ncbi:MAG TPA: hypothetical protein PK453_11765, partial [Leptospiraceae bacterium]|nr:hypothetical protein [Leptospiraceae bacterium]
AEGEGDGGMQGGSQSRGGAIARFTQADSIIDANSVQGMNQYMYTEGNPVNFRDPSRHKKMDALMGKIASAMMMTRIFNKDDNSATNYYRLVMLSKMMSSRNKKGSWYNRSDLSTAVNWTSPMNIIGAAWAGHNYISGRLMGLNTQIHQDRYGFHVTDAPHMNGGDTGINMGYFSVQAGDRRNVTKHENGHKQQFHQWGADAYTGVFGLRLTGKGAGWPETNADRRAGTFAYDRNNDTLFIYLRLIDFVRSKDLNQYAQDGFIADYGYVK